MKTEEIQAIRQEFIARYAKAPRGWLTKMARRIGWSVGALGCFRRGDYPFDHGPIAVSLKAEFERMDQEKGRRRAMATNMAGCRIMAPQVMATNKTG